MVSGLRLVAGGMLCLVLLAGCASHSRAIVRSPAATREAAPSGASASGSSSPTLGEESFQASEKQIDNHIDQVLANRGVTKEEVIAMTKAKVDPTVIANHVRARGMMVPLSSEDLITLQENGVDTQVVSAMQAASAPPERTAVIHNHYIPTVVGVHPYLGRPVVYYPVY